MVILIWIRIFSLVDEKSVMDFRFGVLDAVDANVEAGDFRIRQELFEFIEEICLAASDIQDFRLL